MDKLAIRGGKALEGSIQISGSKNATLPIAVAAGILGASESRIHNVPNLQDIHTLMGVLRHLGVEIEYADGTLHVDSPTPLSVEAPYDLVRRMRASVYVLGPLLARFGKARVSFPGGCAIGARPVDLHLRGMEALGASIRIEHGYILAEADRLRGARFNLEGPRGASVGATANTLMAAVLAEGHTEIQCAAMEPEIVDLADFLTRMGAKIDGAGTPVISVEGVSELRGTDYNAPPDRIEAASYLAAGAITRGNIRILGAERKHMGAVLGKLTEADIWIDWTGNDAQVTVPNGIRSVDVETATYPGFPTDAQAQYMALMCLAEGRCEIVENIFTERFMHALELQRMGAQIAAAGSRAVVTGVESLTGAPVMASDLRAGMALVLAGLAAKGETIVSRVYHIDRGYERIEEKLAAVGADIRRIRE